MKSNGCASRYASTIVNTTWKPLRNLLIWSTTSYCADCRSWKQRILTKLTGRSTKQLILDRVLLEAARLLRFSDLSVKEIADRLGFSDQFAFSKAFKRQRGEAPLDFRNRG